MFWENEIVFARREPRYEITGRLRKSFFSIELRKYDLEITRYEIEMDKGGIVFRFVPSPITYEFLKTQYEIVFWNRKSLFSNDFGNK